MKILFTGGGSGGHFYPIVAVAQEVNTLIKEKHLIEPRMYFMAPQPYNKKMLYENNIIFKKSPAGKRRAYFSIKNFFDIFKMAWGSFKAFFQVFFIFPDVIFSKGGYASFPTVLSARLFRIPLVIHESDSVPGRVNKWSSDFATKIAVSFPEAVKYFPKEKVAYTGNPIRKELFTLATEGAHEFLHLDKNIPVILILGGSQGSEIINDLIVQSLPDLVPHYQVLHQTGEGKLKIAQTTADVLLEGSEHKERYRAFEYLNTLALRMAAGASDIIISRGGSTIFEIAMWGVPSIIIPLSSAADDHQRRNAFSYARSGGAVVMEEGNLSPHILIAEIKRILDDKEKLQIMQEAAQSFAEPDAARKIAEVLIAIGLQHESK